MNSEDAINYFLERKHSDLRLRRLQKEHPRLLYKKMYPYGFIATHYVADFVIFDLMQP
jgi:hypothetical protein